MGFSALKKFKHFSRKTVENHFIFSEQSKNPHYLSVWKIYKKVADELGLYFPQLYGYAYSEEKDRSRFHGMHCFEVTAERFTRGDFRYSLQLISEESFFSPLKVSLDNIFSRNQEFLIEELARKYFNPDAAEEHAEYISDEFQIFYVS